jgi:hypothetical protein
MADAFGLDEDEVLRSELLGQQSWLDHGFGTRHSSTGNGMVSPQPGDRGWKIATVKQIHSAIVLDIDGPPEPTTEADALVTRTQGLAVAVKTADCLPILLADPRQRVVAAVHAGWRGAAQEIVRATISHLTGKYQTNPSGLIAAIGPGIGKCCFEVGPEVARRFAPWNPRLAEADSKVLLDLMAILVSQLTACGVPESNIAQAGMCTMDRTDLFFSFRKEREHAGRMLSWIGIHPGK